MTLELIEGAPEEILPALSLPAGSAIYGFSRDFANNKICLLVYRAAVVEE